MQYDGTLDSYIYRIEISDTMPSGYWRITGIHVSDEYGQGVAEISAAFNTGFTVYGTSADSEKPFIVNSTIAVSNDEIEQGASSIISAQVTDNVAVSNVTIWLSNWETGKNIAYPSMVYNEQSNRYEYTFVADDTVPSGHWQLRSIHAYDVSGNYDIQDIIDWDIDYYILVKGENDHDWETDEAVEPTCTSGGLTEGFSCSICGKVNIAQETVAAIAHDFSDNAEYCKYNCGTRNPDYAAPVSPTPTPTPTPTPPPTPPPTPTPTPVPTPVTPVTPTTTPTPAQTAPTVNPFTDIRKSDYYYDAVLWAVDNGITTGTSATTFDPNKACTRAEMITFLWRAAGCPEPKGTGEAFVDVPESAYYYKAARWAAEQGITTGTGNGKFDPDGTCSRAQSVTFLYRFAGSPETAETPVFTDTAAESYYADAVAWATANGITTGTGAATFSPNASCTRAQIMTFLYRLQQT